MGSRAGLYYTKWQRRADAFYRARVKLVEQLEKLNPED